MEYHKNLKELSPNQYWLLEHQITAFWHGFGISNDLRGIPADMVTFDKKDNTYTVNKEYMRKKLKRYVKWLETYKQSWNSIEKHPFGIDNLDRMIKDDCHFNNRADVLKMISLLQNND